MVDESHSRAFVRFVVIHHSCTRSSAEHEIRSSFCCQLIFYSCCSAITLAHENMVHENDIIHLIIHSIQKKPSKMRRWRQNMLTICNVCHGLIFWQWQSSSHFFNENRAGPRINVIFQAAVTCFPYSRKQILNLLDAKIVCVLQRCQGVCFLHFERVVFFSFSFY